jgi:hypothetical protein
MSPIALTDTTQVGLVKDALIKYALERRGRVARLHDASGDARQGESRRLGRVADEGERAQRGAHPRRSRIRIDTITP